MRRTCILALLILASALAGCTSGSATRRTVTVVNTVSPSAAVTVPKTSSSLVVGSPAGSPTPAAPKPTPTPTPKAVVAPIVKVNPLDADCAAILDAADMKAAIGATVSAKTNRIRLGAGAHGVSGAIRCLYGSPDGGKSAPVRIRLTQYGSAAAAKAQVKVDVQTAEDGGATITSPTVNGYPASLQLIAGGVIEMPYDTWTLSVAVDDKQATNAKLTSGLPILAGQALDRILKGD